MLHMLNYFLVIGISGILAVVFVRYNGADKIFVKLSVFFMFVFFLIPACMVMFTSGFWYLNKFVFFGDAEFLRAAISMWIFCLGFFIIDINKKVSAKNLRPELGGSHASFSINKSSVIFIFVLGLIFFVLYRFLAPEGEELYAVRQEKAEGDHVLFLLSIISNALMLSAFFLCVKAKWWALSAACMLLICVGYLAGSPGRTTVLLTLTLFSIFLFRISPKLIVSLLPVITIVALPLILNGKQIIYEAVINGRIVDISGFYNVNSIESDVLFRNIAHPFVSMVFASELTDAIGLRFFYDYLQGVLFYLRLFGLNFGESITYYNTELLLGVRSSMIPTGYLAFGYAQLPYLGVLVSGLFYRLTIKVATATAIYKAAHGKELNFYMSFISAYTFYTGELRQLVISFFLPLLVMHFVGLFAAKAVVTTER